MKPLAVGLATVIAILGMACGAEPTEPVLTPPRALRFVLQPSDVGSGLPLAPVEVALFDANGDFVDHTDRTVHLRITPEGSQLLGTVTVMSHRGLARFPGLSVTDLNTGYRLVAEADGLESATSSPFAVFAPYVSLAVGNVHACAASPERVYCWGNNEYGQLGIGSFQGTPIPTPVVGSEGFTELLGGSLAMCARNAALDVICWGDNTQRGFGRSDTLSTTTPVPGVPGLGFEAVSPGRQHHACGLIGSDGWCWGDGSVGQLGDSAFHTASTPVRISGAWSLRTIAAGGQHSCGITFQGGVVCWGVNGWGQLGTPEPADQIVPTPVASGETYNRVRLGDEHTCALTAEGFADCWGKNANGEAGVGHTRGVRQPTRIPDLRWSSIRPGYAHTCGVTIDGVAYCWGRNASGELGTGDVIQWVTPEPVNLPGTLFTDVVTGYRFSCGLATTGEVFCWGGNTYGQLGDGTHASSLTPRKVRRVP